MQHTKKKLTFNLLKRSNGKFQGKWVDANPFETLNEEVGALGFLKETLEVLEEGWTFQGKKKHKVNITTTRPTTDHPPNLMLCQQKFWGKRKVRNTRSSTTLSLNP
jgi:hypothetical protein